jgi:hypothetical protein
MDWLLPFRVARVESAWRALAAWFARVEASAWSAAAAWCALIISLANFWYSVIRVWWRNRRASPAAQLDLLSYQAHGKWKEEERVVVTNHGPHVMESVKVEVFGGARQSLGPSVAALWPSMPIERLHTGQSLYLTLNLSPGAPPTRSAEIAWKDGRRSRQWQRVNLSYNRVK